MSIRETGTALQHCRVRRLVDPVVDRRGLEPETPGSDHQDLQQLFRHGRLRLRSDSRRVSVTDSSHFRNRDFEKSTGPATTAATTTTTATAAAKPVSEVRNTAAGCRCACHFSSTCCSSCQHGFESDPVLIHFQLRLKKIEFLNNCSLRLCYYERSFSRPKN